MSKNMYDVYFTLEEPAVIAVDAKNKEEAEDMVSSMNNGILLERIGNALDYMGVKVVKIERIDY